MGAITMMAFGFQSTLSMRRATYVLRGSILAVPHFNPRSP